MFKKYKYQIIGSIIVILALSLINVHIGLVDINGEKQSMILAERFFKGGAWIEIFLVVIYTFYIIGKMISAKNTAKWRKLTWTIFSIVFFSQLLLGILGFEKFLMTGMMHLPIPALIIGGAIYKMKFGFMPILFLSTVILSGPAWCSQLCYFGAVDFQASSKKGKPAKIKNKSALKHTFLAIVIVGAIILRFLDLSYFLTGIIAGSFGIIGILVIMILSRKKKMMYHCSVYCPVGTILQYVKFINPFRMYIEDNSCTNCMLCTPTCKYDALNTIDIQNRKPGLSCTYCGDCVSSCHSSSIKYKVFNIKGDKARFIWITLTISLHSIFLVLARI